MRSVEQLIVTNQSALSIWSSPVQRQLREGIVDLAFSPDSQLLAIASGLSVTLWDAVSGQRIRESHGHLEGVSCLAFHPDGLTLATGSEYKTVKVWSISDGVVKRTLCRHQDASECIAYGETLARGGGDAVLRLWRLRPSEEASSVGGAGHTLLDLALQGPDCFGPGCALVPATSDSLVRSRTFPILRLEPRSLG